MMMMMISRSKNGGARVASTILQYILALYTRVYTDIKTLYYRYYILTLSSRNELARKFFALYYYTR